MVRKLPKAILVSALCATISLGFATGDEPKVGTLFPKEKPVQSTTDSLFLMKEGFMVPADKSSEIPQMRMDDLSDASTVQYTLESTGTPEPHEIIFNKTNSGALLGIAAVLGLAYFLRDRLFPHYR